MESNSTQGLAVLVFLVAFTFLGGAFFTGAKLLFIVLFLIAAALSVALFQKVKNAKPADESSNWKIEAQGKVGTQRDVAIGKKTL